MTTRKTLTAISLAAICAALWLGLLTAAEPTGQLLIVDSAGKEQKVKTWKIVAGTRHLAWLAPAPALEKKEEKEPQKDKAAPKKKPTAGPEALELREEKSTGFVEGILTLVPLESIKSIDFDNEKQTITVKVAGDGAPELTGTTKFRGINKLSIEAEVDKGDLGVAELRFVGGVPKGIQSVKFPDPKANPAAKDARVATVLDTDKKEKGTHKVANLQALYRLPDGSERLLPTLWFKKSLKVDVSKIKKIVASEGGNQEAPEWAVTLKDGDENTLTLLKAAPVDEKMTLVGLLGTVPAGYKLFPVHTIHEIQFEEAKSE